MPEPKQSRRQDTSPPTDFMNAVRPSGGNPDPSARRGVLGTELLEG